MKKIVVALNDLIKGNVIHRDLKLKNMMLHFPDNEEDLLGQDEKEMIQNYQENMTSKISMMMKTHSSRKNHVFHKSSANLVCVEDHEKTNAQLKHENSKYMKMNYTQYRIEARKRFIN